jgi:hypothetical protein
MEAVLIINASVSLPESFPPIRLLIDALQYDPPELGLREAGKKIRIQL